MPSDTVARDILWPTDPQILLRAVFLYVGQGASTIIMAADGETYGTLLVDINLDAERGGVDVPRLLADLVEGNRLDAFVNTHPHDDHLRGVERLAEEVGVSQVWHSGHKPGKKHEDAYRSLMALVEAVKKAGGEEVILQGSRDEQRVGDARYYVLAPAEYVSDDVQDEAPEVRYNRIHEQCAVLKFGTAPSWVMTPGDADRDAFEKHITDYHRDRLPAVVLAAPHHGSRTFFRCDENDDPYLEGLNAIDPDYVIISAPKRDESPHGHPHADAVGFYADKVEGDSVLHTGENSYCYICDIYHDGNYGGVRDDKGTLAEAYPLNGGDGEGGGRPKRVARKVPAVVVGTKVDDRPMGST